MPSFKRLVRFESADGKNYYGEAPESALGPDLVGTEIPVYDDPFGAQNTLSSSKKEVVKVLSPIPQAAHIYGVGLNYKAHAQEASASQAKAIVMATPEYPMIFSKPNDALAGPYEDIPIDKECTLMDYEGEFCVVIGKDCKNIPEGENPLDYVLGFCVANDVSSRYWQMPERAGQAGYAKGFDKFAPIGPILVSPDALPDIGSLRLTTKVNDEERQTTMLDDLIFDIPTLIRHLSRGLTLRKFTVILTGTPSGVGALRKPPLWLEDGDVVTIEIDKIGKISNRMKFAQ